MSGYFSPGNGGVDRLRARAGAGKLFSFFLSCKRGFEYICAKTRSASGDFYGI